MSGWDHLQEITCASITIDGYAQFYFDRCFLPKFQAMAPPTAPPTAPPIIG
ncbi:MAG: hypothetical protein ABGY15_09745 [bacterium]